MHDIITRTGEHLPQAPTNVAEQLSQEEIWDVATEALLFGSSTGLKCLAASHVGTEPIEVPEIHGLIKESSDPGIQLPGIKDIRTALSYGHPDAFTYSEADDTFALNPGYSDVTNFSTALLGVALDTRVPVTIFSSTHGTRNEWEGFTSLRSVRRARIILGITSAGNNGITTTGIMERSGYPDDRKIASKVPRILAKLGLVKIDKEASAKGRIENRVTASPRLIEASLKFRGLLELISTAPAQLEDIAHDAAKKIERMKASGHLARHSMLSVGKGKGVIVSAKYEAVLEFVKMFPEGVGSQQIFEALGEELGYTSPESFITMLSKMRKNDPHKRLVMDLNGKQSGTAKYRVGSGANSRFATV